MKVSKYIAVPSLLALANQAYAAVPVEVTDAISDASADALTVAGLLTAMVAVIWGALYLKRKFFG
jgi:hypothetical protein